MSNYLTKSKFTNCLDCPTKLYYSSNKGYPSTIEDDDFLEALAKGGVQVGELAKLYYPGGNDITSLDYEESIQQTNELLEQENVIIYEAAIAYDQCFIRVDILEKKGDSINLIEVKSKSWSPDKEFLTKRNKTISSDWQKYLYDIAFQYWVTERAFSGYEINPYLMLIDKTKIVSVDGLHQNFRVVEEKGRYKVTIKEGIAKEDLGEQILASILVKEEVNQIIEGEGREPKSELESEGFVEWIYGLSEHLKNGTKYPVLIGDKCKKCEYRMAKEKLENGEKSGFEECWREALEWEDDLFEEPHVFDIWNERSVQKFLDSKIYLMRDLYPDLLPVKSEGLYDLNDWNSNQRKTVQIMKSTGHDPDNDVLLDGFRNEMENWTYPLYFIDFEAILPAIPFHKGLNPYQYVPFQFSCHKLKANGEFDHIADWIEEEPGKLPNIDFVRNLKACLEKDDGTIFRYHYFENTVLNKTADLIKKIAPKDAKELLEFISLITKGGEREMVDQWELVKKYYYSPYMKGSISIKDVLPAVLTESEKLQEIYSNPYSGLYLNEKVFYQPDPDTGVAVSPYKLLEPIGHGIPDYEEGDKYADKISEGGAAMMAWGRIQFDDINDAERQAILKSLYEYCELDTLAMVMIQQYWTELCK